MNFRLHVRLHFAIVILMNICSSTHVFSSTDVDLETSITVGSRTGLFANIYTSGEEEISSQEGQTGIVSSQANVAPGIVLTISSRRIRFVTTYFLTLSNNVMVQDRFRLNLYQQGGLQLSTGLSRTLTLSAEAGIRNGFLDYSTALYSSVSDNEVPANLLPAQELFFYNITSSLGLNKRWSRRAGSGISLSFNTYRTYGYSESEEVRLADRYQTTLSLNHNHAITRRDELNAAAIIGINMFVPGMNLLTIQGTTGWRHAFTENLMLSISAGLLALYVIGDNDYERETGLDDSLSSSQVSPLGTIAYSQRFNLKKRKILNLNMSGTYNSYLDQMTASSRQRLLFSIGIDLDLTSEWSILASGTISSLFTTSFANRNPEADIIPTDYPTTAYLNLGASYLLSSESGFNSDIRLNFGITSNARWAELWSENLRVRAFEEFIVYINIAARKRYMEP